MSGHPSSAILRRPSQRKLKVVAPKPVGVHSWADLKLLGSWRATRAASEWPATLSQGVAASICQVLESSLEVNAAKQQRVDVSSRYDNAASVSGEKSLQYTGGEPSCFSADSNSPTVFSQYEGSSIRSWLDPGDREGLKLAFAEHAPSNRQQVQLLERWMTIKLKEAAYESPTAIEPNSKPAVIDSQMKTLCLGMMELIRQVRVHCSDRGDLLEKIWQSINNLFVIALDEMTLAVNDAEARHADLAGQLQRCQELVSQNEKLHMDVLTSRVDDLNSKWSRKVAEVKAAAQEEKERQEAQHANLSLFSQWFPNFDLYGDSFLSRLLPAPETSDMDEKFDDAGPQQDSEASPDRAFAADLRRIQKSGIFDLIPLKLEDKEQCNMQGADGSKDAASLGEATGQLKRSLTMPNDISCSSAAGRRNGSSGGVSDLERALMAASLESKRRVIELQGVADAIRSELHRSESRASADQLRSTQMSCRLQTSIRALILDCGSRPGADVDLLKMLAMEDKKLQQARLRSQTKPVMTLALVRREVIAGLRLCAQGCNSLVQEIDSLSLAVPTTCISSLASVTPATALVDYCFKRHDGTIQGMEHLNHIVLSLLAWHPETGMQRGGGSALHGLPRQPTPDEVCALAEFQRILGMSNSSPPGSTKSDQECLRGLWLEIFAALEHLLPPVNPTFAGALPADLVPVEEAVAAVRQALMGPAGREKEEQRDAVEMGQAKASMTAERKRRRMASWDAELLRGGFAASRPWWTHHLSSVRAAVDALRLIATKHGGSAIPLWEALGVAAGGFVSGRKHLLQAMRLALEVADLHSGISCTALHSAMHIIEPHLPANAVDVLFRKAAIRSRGSIPSANDVQTVIMEENLPCSGLQAPLSSWDESEGGTRLRDFGRQALYKVEALTAEAKSLLAKVQNLPLREQVGTDATLMAARISQLQSFAAEVKLASESPSPSVASAPAATRVWLSSALLELDVGVIRVYGSLRAAVRNRVAARHARRSSLSQVLLAWRRRGRGKGGRGG